MVEKGWRLSLTFQTSSYRYTKTIPHLIRESYRNVTYLDSCDLNAVKRSVSLIGKLEQFISKVLVSC